MAPTGRRVIRLVAIFNFGVIQRAEAVCRLIKLASESHFPNYASIISIPHISEEKERRGAGSNIFLAGVHMRIGKVDSGVERLAHFEPMFIANSTPNILRERIPALPIGCIENCISFDQNCSATTNVRDCKLRRYRTIRRHLEDSLHFAHYNSWACGCYESTLCSIGGNFGRLQRPENKIALTSANYGQQPSKSNQEKIEPPAGIIWWRRGMACFTLLVGAFYATRNGFRDLLRGWKIHGWGWLCGAFLFGELAVFNLWLGIFL